MNDVPFRLDTGSGVPFYRQVIDQVLLAVADGRLKPGTQLPTVRQLAVDLSVNLNTVAKAYREMEIRGIVETQQGTGTFVSDRRPERRSAERDRALGRLVDQFLALGTSRGFSVEEIQAALAERVERPAAAAAARPATLSPGTEEEEDMLPIAAIRKRKKAAEAADAERADPPSGARQRSDTVQVRRFVNPVSIAAAVLCFAGAGAAAAITQNPLAAAAGLALGVYLMFAIKIAQQWERAVVLRLGRFTKLAGPGPFVLIPIVDEISHLVDQRVRVTSVTAESALTKDTVPVNVDAIVFWTVWDAKKSILEVASYRDAVSLSAQTALRETIGRHQLAEMITEREKLGKQLQAILDEKTNPWGITVGSVEIRDVKIPSELEDAMSRQAQAERERQARIILGTAETEIASRFVAAGEEYRDRPLALHLRAMNMLYEAIKEKGSMVIVPSSAVETMGLGGLSGIAALSNGAKPPAG